MLRLAWRPGTWVLCALGRPRATPARVRKTIVHRLSRLLSGGAVSGDGEDCGGDEQRRETDEDQALDGLNEPEVGRGLVGGSLVEAEVRELGFAGSELCALAAEMSAFTQTVQGRPDCSRAT